MIELVQTKPQRPPASTIVPMLAPDAREAALRERLGIPATAQRVLVLGESSHWDPNWLLTSHEYYKMRVEKILDQALDALVASPSRVYSVESIFFLRMYHERREDRRALLTQMLNEGRLRLIGAGVSSPDTLVTPLEGLLRDYLTGAEWLKSVGVVQTARVAYFPDNFGHSPCLPSMLRALSLPYAGITRIDGMFFPGTDYRPESEYPAAGSSAERLLKDERSLTFRWQAPDGSEVLCHWNAFGYGHGDLLGHLGLTRWMGLPLARASRSIPRLIKQVDALVAQLSPLSRTPYMFCPIGFDFVSPLAELPHLIGNYNQAAFESTGTYVVNAGLDDYLDLVSCSNDKLPTLSLDPNPYWMGFYASRPQLKRSHWDLVARASRIEAAHALAVEGSDESAQRTLAQVWDSIAFSNHHDFVTGTSPDRVFFKEQRPLLAVARAKLDGLEARTVPAARSEVVADGGLSTHREGDLLVIDNGFLAVTFDAARGGAIREVRDLRDGTVLLGRDSFDLTVYRDGGGLWRMGHEFRGGRFSYLCSASEERAELRCERRGDALEVSVETPLDGHSVLRRIRLKRGSRFLWLSSRGDAKTDRTVHARFALPWSSPTATMGCAGGTIGRESVRHFDPTYWPAQGFVHLRDPVSDRGLVLFPGGVGSISFDGKGALSYVVQRTARLERAWGVLPVLGFPAAGRERGAHEAELAVTWTRSGDHRANHLAGLAQAVSQGHEDLEIRHVSTSCIVSDQRVSVIAFKRASNGHGQVVRLFAPDGYDDRVMLSLKGFEIMEAIRCDALERDLEPLSVEEGAARFRLAGCIDSVRLTLRARAR